MHIEIKTERLLLRPLCMNDIDTVHLYASDAELTRYMLYLPNSNVEESRRFIEAATSEWSKSAPEFFEFAVVSDGIHIGAVCLYLSENGTKGEIGWILNKEYHGKGYASEAAVAVLEYAKSIGVTEVCAHCDSRNRASENVMRRIGMKLESSDGIRFYKKSSESASELMYISRL
ncbi:MAG: GNAT family N-acetyltransferase [Ruminococcaceae bacterium]|nr:GNAT family N-acetyltransferase [Oscillospiraceae bacterium]